MVGNDAITGARRMFKSRPYKTLTLGCFSKWSGPQKKRYNIYYPSKKAIEAISNLDNIVINETKETEDGEE